MKNRSEQIYEQIKNPNYFKVTGYLLLIFFLSFLVTLIWCIWDFTSVWKYCLTLFILWQVTAGIHRIMKRDINEAIDFLNNKVNGTDIIKKSKFQERLDKYMEDKNVKK